MLKFTCQSCGVKLPPEFEEWVFCPSCGERLVASPILHLKPKENEAAYLNVALTIYPYSYGLVKEVEDLILRKRYTLAVVVAQMACEVSAEHALQRAFEEKKIDEPLRSTITNMLSGRSFTNGNVRKVYDALTSKNTHKELEAIGIWQGLIKLAEWRNAAVHRGATWTEAEAETALKIANTLVEFIYKTEAEPDLASS